MKRFRKKRYRIIKL